MTQFLQTSLQQLGLGGIVFVIWYLDRKQLQKRNEQLDKAQEAIFSFANLLAHLEATIERNTLAFGTITETMRGCHKNQ